MKALFLAAFLPLSAIAVHAQESSQDKAIRQQCVDIASKLYPDVLNRDSEMIAQIVKLQKIMKARDSTILDMPQEPLVVAACAADILKIQPKWSALSDDEKETAYYVLSDAMVFARDLAPPDATSTENKAAPSIPQVGIAAFHCYLNEVLSPDTDRFGKLNSGPGQGLTRDEATVYAKRAWLQMSDDQKANYEKMAEETGDPIAQQAASQANAPIPIRVLQGQGQ